MACPRLLTALILATAFPVDGALAQMPPAIAAPGEDIATFHAEGAQIYECKPGNESKLAWVFREPIATLLLDDKTVGRHYAGPTWEHGDGSAVTGKAVGNAPGTTVTITRPARDDDVLPAFRRRLFRLLVRTGLIERIECRYDLLPIFWREVHLS